MTEKKNVSKEGENQGFSETDKFLLFTIHQKRCILHSSEERGTDLIGVQLLSTKSIRYLT